MIIEIRPVRKEDLEICEKLVAQPEAIAFNGQFVSKGWLSTLKDDGISYVIKSDDKIVGCTFGEKLKMNGYLLWLIAIDPEYKNMGFGTKLMECVETECKKKGIDWIILYSTTESKSNCYFYTKLGYINKSGSFWEFGKKL
jgi:GNAT superfamily N-acetyltransferase